MNLTWRIAALQNGFKDAIVYRLEFLMEVFGSAFMPALVQWVLWYAMFKIGGAQTVGGMGYSDMLMYTFTSLLFSQVRGGDHDFELQEMIREGSLSNYLLKPVGVVEFVYIRGVAPKILVAGLGLLVGCIVGSFFGLSPLRMVGAMFLALIGNIIHYQIGAALATMAFYWEEAYSVLMVKNMLVGVLSGEMIPLNLFPENLKWIWESTPFYLYVFGPVQFATGKWTVDEYIRQLGFSAIWLIVGWVLIRITWGIGIKKYSSLGG